MLIARSQYLRMINAHGDIHINVSFSFPLIYDLHFAAHGQLSLQIIWKGFFPPNTLSSYLRLIHSLRLIPLVPCTYART